MVTAIIAVALFVGTFYPNKWITEKIEREFHKQEVKEVIYLGLIQPEFDYNDKKTFIAATGKCCLLYTSPSPRDGLLSRMPSSA